jgi:hypothetical protein
MVFNLFKRKDIPEELPSLATEELKKNPEIEKYTQLVNKYLKQKNQEPEPKEPEISEDAEDGFFNKMQEDIHNEIANLNQLENWYKNKFLPQDVVSDMRNYWENQKSDSVIKVIGRNFKEKITEKTEKLQQLERDWQETYFQLIEKEEEIRKEEQELKKILSEFVELCKARKKKKK